MRLIAFQRTFDFGNEYKSNVYDEMISVMGTDHVNLGEHFPIESLIELQNIFKLKKISNDTFRLIDFLDLNYLLFNCEIELNNDVTIPSVILLYELKKSMMRNNSIENIQKIVNYFKTNIEKIKFIIGSHKILYNILSTIFSTFNDIKSLSIITNYPCIKLKIFKWYKSICSLASKNGHIECLKYFHENGYSWGTSTCSCASQNGHIECLKYAHENGCPWDTETCSYASLNGHLECLIYAHEHSCPWNKETCEKASLNGHLQCLKYAHENGCPWDTKTCEKASYYGHIECLKYAHENGCPLTRYTFQIASQYGSLECLKYLYENGCPWDELIFKYVKLNKNPECIKYVYEKMFMKKCCLCK